MCTPIRTRIGPDASASSGCGNGIRRAPEGVEGCVALRINLYAAVRRKRFPQDTPVLGQQAGEAIRPYGLKDACRALDVGEQEGHGSRRKVARHNVIMRHPQWPTQDRGYVDSTRFG